MTRPAVRAKTRRRWLAGLGIASLALATSGCEAPPHAALVKCSGTSLSYGDMRHDCTLTVAKSDRQTSASIKIDTPRRLAYVKGHFTVQQGSVRVALKGNAGSKTEVMVSPGNPGTLEGTVRLRRDGGSFQLHFSPVGEFAGLQGQFSYEAR